MPYSNELKELVIADYQTSKQLYQTATKHGISVGTLKCWIDPDYRKRMYEKVQQARHQKSQEATVDYDKIVKIKMREIPIPENITPKDYTKCVKWARCVWAYSLKGGKCEKCGDDNIFHLVFHHTRDKEIGVSKLLIGKFSKMKVQQEVEKCILLCRNCHVDQHTNSTYITKHFDYITKLAEII